MGIILRLIAMGVPASKIIAKYGKKAYNVAKKRYTQGWKENLSDKIIETVPEQAIGVAALGAGYVESGKAIARHLENKRIKKEDKAKRGPRDEKRYGGKTKSKYSKGGGVRSAKYKI